MAQAQKTALVKWDEELVRMAEEAAHMEANTGGGQFFSLRGGILSLNDAPVPNNEIAVIILDSVLENVFYQGDFDPESPQAPSCYAFGRDEDTIAPHEAAGDKQCDSCASCPMNAWGSSNKGRGKACRNRRRLACIPAGDLSKAGDFTPIEDPALIGSTQVYYLPIPTTSINSYGAYVKQLAGGLRRPPHAVFTRIRVVPDPKSQFKVCFEVLGTAPDSLIPVLMKRNAEQRDQTGFAYPKVQESSPKAQKAASAKAPRARRAPVQQQPAQPFAAPAQQPAQRARKF